jgi:hypothetical protein
MPKAGLKGFRSVEPKAMASSTDEWIARARPNLAHAMLGERQQLDVSIRERERRAW